MGEGLGVAVSCGVGRRCGLDPVWLWLWCRPVAVALIGPLAWEPPYALGAASEKAKKTKKKKNPTAAAGVAVEVRVHSPAQHSGLKDPALPQLQRGSQLWLRFDPWPGNFPMPWVWPFKKKSTNP